MASKCTYDAEAKRTKSEIKPTVNNAMGDIITPVFSCYILQNMSNEVEELNDAIEALIDDMGRLQSRIETLSRGARRNKLLRLQRRYSNMLDRLFEELGELEGERTGDVEHD